MKELVYDLVIGLLIVGLLITVAIPAFRNNGDLIAASAKKVDEIEKIKAQPTLSLEKGEVAGSDVISAIRYYKDELNVQIVVVIGANSKTYTAENYNSGVFNIPYEMRFTVKNTFNPGHKLVKAEYTQKP